MYTPHSATQPADMTSETISTRLRKQRYHWDAIALDIPDLLQAPSTQYYRRCEIALIRRFIGPLKGKRILKLDLWNEAVNTRILQWMASQGAETYGLDLSTVTTQRAAENTRATDLSIHMHQGDIRYIPFKDRTFDFVYTMGTIEHIDEYREAVAEVFRVLKPGGQAIIGVPHKWNIFLRPLLVKIMDLLGRYPYSPEKSFGAGTLRRIIEASGLHARQRTGILMLPGIVRLADLFLFRRNNPLYRLTPLFLWPFDRLETHYAWPGWFGYLIAYVAERPEDPEAVSNSGV